MLTIQQLTDPQPLRYTYRCLGDRLQTDLPIPEFAAFVDNEVTLSDSALAAPQLPDHWQTIFSGDSWLGGGLQALRCLAGTATPGEMTYQLAGSTLGLSYVHRQAVFYQLATPSTMFGTLLAPSLILALANQNVWLLHASAAAWQGKAYIFLGESGQGKSTLARWLGQHAGWQQLTDDASPIALRAGQPVLLTHFPQPKFVNQAAQLPYIPAVLPIAGIIQIDTATTETTMTATRLPALPALQQLIRHTMCIKLFHTLHLQRHASDCTQLLQRLAVSHLCYPKQWSVLPTVSQYLQGDALGQQPS
jgi:hypothetical protein